MALNIGNMRRSIVVQRLYTTKNEYGAETSTYVDYLTLKAELKNRSGSKTIVNNEIFNDATLIFWTHYRPIVETDRIKFNGNVYNILNIAEIGYREGLELVLSKINE